VISAIQALTTDNPATARQFIEQLLDQRDLNAAQSVIAAAPQPLLIDPDIAFVRGRLNWQQAAVGQSGASPNDALRAWSQALDGRKDFLEAWVAIGFAHYALLDYDQAVRAWEEALRLDEERLRDRDPDGPRQVSSSYTPNAIAGLALARQKQSEQAIDPAERQQLEEEARRNLLLVTGLDPTILDPVLLIQRWLWTQRLAEDWQTAVERLSVSSPPVEPTNN
jgi:tetratricopeptide (TPR) repeat protein